MTIRLQLSERTASRWPRRLLRTKGSADNPGRRRNEPTPTVSGQTRLSTPFEPCQSPSITAMSSPGDLMAARGTSWPRSTARYARYCCRGRRPATARYRGLSWHFERDRLRRPFDARLAKNLGIRIFSLKYL